MKHTLFHRANYVLSILGLLSGLGMYELNEAIKIGEISIKNELLWFLFTLGLIFIGLISGKAISKLHHWAYRDFLTNTWNRKYFTAKLHAELCKRQQTGLSMCIALLDMDDFKRVNDSYGHAVGDQVIQQVADVLKNNVRAADAVIRLGGDEFAVIFPGTELRKAYGIAERVRMLVDAQCDYVTVSVGVIEVDREMGLSDLLRLVDESLYCAKQDKNAVRTMAVGL